MAQFPSTPPCRTAPRYGVQRIELFLSPTDATIVGVDLEIRGESLLGLRERPGPIELETLASNLRARGAALACEALTSRPRTNARRPRSRAIRVPPRGLR